MRIAAIVIATLCLLASAGLGLARSNTNFKDAKELAQVDEQTAALAQAMDVKEASVLAVKPAALKRGGVGLILTGLLSIAALVSVFVKKGVPYLAGALALCAVITIVLNPQYETGALQATSARNAAIVVGILAGAGALFAFLADRIRVRRQAAA